MTPATASRAPATIPSLDGLRAIAVGLVFFAHSGLAHVVPGGLGVTIFFVLSGFLITTLMRKEYGERRRLDLPAFYLRRALRLMPPLFIVVAAASLLAHFGAIGGGFSGAGLASVLFYFGNYHMIARDFAGVPEGLGVVWSLAVEEHYYLLYPPLAMLLLPLPRARAALVLGLLCAAVLAWRCALALHGQPAAYLEMATDTRADAILAGCLLAFWRNPALDGVLDAGAWAGTIPWRERWLAGGCALLLLATLLVRDDFFRGTLRYTLQAAAIAPLLYLAVARAGHAPFRWLNARPLVYLGTISYTVYLSHQLVLFGVQRHAPDLGWTATLTLTALLTLAIAEPMRRFVERPCAQLRRQLHARASVRGAPSAPLPPAHPAPLAVPERT